MVEGRDDCPKLDQSHPEIHPEGREIPPFPDPCQSRCRTGLLVLPHSTNALEGEIDMVLDSEAYIALGMLVSILVVTGGLAWWLLSRLGR